MMPTQAAADRWWHLPHDLPAAWFAGIAAERRDPETGRWEKTAASARNEPIDTAVYAWAIAHLTHNPRLPRARRLAIGTWSAREWEQLTARQCPTQGDLFQPEAIATAIAAGATSPSPPPGPPPAATPAPPAPPADLATIIPRAVTTGGWKKYDVL